MKADCLEERNHCTRWNACIYKTRHLPEEHCERLCINISFVFKDKSFTFNETENAFIICFQEYCIAFSLKSSAEPFKNLLFKTLVSVKMNAVQCIDGNFSIERALVDIDLSDSNERV